MSQLKTEPRAAKPAAGQRAGGAGGRRLAAAFDTVSSLPALADIRDRLLGLAGEVASTSDSMAAAVEADVGLTIAVMQAANNGNGPRGRAGSVPEAVAELSDDRLVAIASRTTTYDLLSPGSGAERCELFRRHAMSVRSAADRIGELARIADRDELVIAALLHDVGRLVLGELYGEDFGIGLGGETPEDRVHHERRELGIDHALIGAVLIRRWGLPAPIASAVERHHADDAQGLAAAVKLADMVAHHAAGARVSPDLLRATGASLGIDENDLRVLLVDFPHSGVGRRRITEPCPLSARELDALRGLGEGKVYKQIAQELSLSVSTVRTHLHNVYKKIGAVDRAQAVLLARERGWL